MTDECTRVIFFSQLKKYELHPRISGEQKIEIEL